MSLSCARIGLSEDEDAGQAVLTDRVDEGGRPARSSWHASGQVARLGLRMI